LYLESGDYTLKAKVDGKEYDLGKISINDKNTRQLVNFRSF
jgi:hypothetical protein